MILEPKKIIPLLNIGYGMTVLDMGSSIGYWTKPLSHIVGNSGKIIAIDSHAEIIARLNHDATELSMTNVHAITGDLHDLPNLAIKQGTVDRVLLIRMLSIIESDPDKKIKELLAFAKPEGKLIIIDHSHHKDELLNALAGHDDISIDELTRVEEVSEGHFFGVILQLVSS